MYLKKSLPGLKASRLLTSHPIKTLYLWLPQPHSIFASLSKSIKGLCLRFGRDACTARQLGKLCNQWGEHPRVKSPLVATLAYSAYTLDIYQGLQNNFG
jgi:hypothetical protein